MSGNRLPAAVRIPSVIASQSGPEDDHQDSIVVEIPSSNKFAIEWPADSSAVGHAHLPVQAKERPVTLSSSEGETEISEEEHDGVRTRWSSRPEDSDAEFVTPTNNMDSDNNPMDQVEQPPTVPRLSRAFSMPLPSQLGFLQNPRRTTTPSNSSASPGSEVLPELDCYQELSLELADSVQMVIQTLLQLSPPQILDPAKEQFSACSLSIPTPSMSAMFTSMKNLNYMSANMATISSDHQSSAAASALNKDASHHDFDVAEMLQSVGDVLSGVAAQAGVDLVLFHGDVGMKHVSAKGDESGISYTLSHIIRQVISVCERGDTVEIGLFIESVRDDDDPEAIRSTPSPNLDTSFRCLFHIAHRYRLTEAADGAPQRSEPQFSSLILRRLLRHVGAALEIEAKPRVPVLIGRSCELAIVFEPGEPSVLNPQALITPEDAALVGYPEYRIANEPSLEQLTTFAESLRGRKATLYANSRGSFAHHLSSYLTAWGMDVSHVSTEHDTEGERFEVPVDPLTPTPASSAPESTVPSSPGPKAPSTQTASFTFIMIDDDVNVLRNRLDKIKAELGYPLHLSRKRPSLASNHRPRSSPSVARFMGGFANSHSSPPTQYVIVHFTSLANYKLVKDAIQSLANFTGLGPRIPEVIVIPKPAGPRRFLTALHTAVTKPVVDPFFIPIATSPISPGLHGISPLFNFANPARSPGGRSTGSGRTPSDRSTKSPKEPGDIYPHAPSSPLAGSDGMEYFSDSVGRLGTSPSTGLVIQSPDGQPAGIFFQPSAKGRSPSMASLPGHSAQTPRMEREYPKESHSRVRGGSVRSEGSNSFAQSFSEMSRPGPRPSVAASDSETTSTSTLKVKMVPLSVKSCLLLVANKLFLLPEALP
ncbi:hypothetical protein QCA50_000184 [Cerrena zonata]|uniref:Uncharacterized protein n=1 Tax=Cerrena zonata TaxID=2478898 RepID=A0AAW0GPL3_9APHY